MLKSRRLPSILITAVIIYYNCNINKIDIEMIQIKLPDGNIKTFTNPITVIDLAKSVSISLAKIVIAANVDGVLRDNTYTISRDCSLSLVTDKDKEGLDIIRHSTSHLLAHAVKQLFPQAQVAIGPVIENGFYYDFSYERAFTLVDLQTIENKMQEIVNQNLEIKRQELSREDAIAYFNSIGENYKVDIINNITEDQMISVYTQGDFTDLCKGPHVASTGKLKAFKLTKIAGAYWRGDSNNEMLQRIYGTAWASKQDLQNYLNLIEEAEKRDHRKLGKQLGLFHQQDEAPGMVFWHPKGWTVWQQIELYLRKLYVKYGYQEVKTPQLVDRILWEKSGHWEKFGENMFSLELDNRYYAIKPMNCPCHVQIFNHTLTSYRQLPIRLAEFGSCHRNESSGALHGIMRTRNFVQDDAHIFCMPEQIQNEVMLFIDMLFEVYRQFGLEDIAVKLSTRPDKRIGSEEVWDRSEQALASALDAKQLQWQLLPGEGAFYGPKIEFEIKDCIGRSWTTGSMQLDFSMPERLLAKYVAVDGTYKTPVMLHRAICGSLERFIGILIEHYAGNFPLWLAPVQLVVLNISQQQSDYAAKIYSQLQQYGFRCQIDLSNDKISYKIRQYSLQKVPYLVIVGDNEVINEKITLRRRGGDNLGTMALQQLCRHLNDEL